jgi:hypothetical protein
VWTVSALGTCSSRELHDAYNPINLTMGNKAFPSPGTKLVRSCRYAESLISMTAKLEVELPDGKTEYYFLKVCT